MSLRTMKTTYHPPGGTSVRPADAAFFYCQVSKILCKLSIYPAAVFGTSSRGGKIVNINSSGDIMKNRTLKIEGMSCGHCVMALKNELSNVDGITVTTAAVGSADIVVDEIKVTELRIKEAVAEAGFSLASIQ